MSLEQSIDFINRDELVEITPEHIRLRKKILQETLRLRGIASARKSEEE
jgi:GTP-binding protein